jgi:hypothetical protein
MNITLWIFQFLLALHTLIGAIWKFSKTAEQTMPTLKAIPQGVWLGMSVFEILCALALLSPLFNKSLGFLAPTAAVCIAVDMLILCAVHIFSGEKNFGPMIYWGVVILICAFIFYGRFALKPL